MTNNADQRRLLVNFVRATCGVVEIEPEGKTVGLMCSLVMATLLLSVQFPDEAGRLFHRLVDEGMPYDSDAVSQMADVLGLRNES